jgi:hypothetical protein
VRLAFVAALGFFLLPLPAHGAGDAWSSTMTVRVIATSARTKVLVDRAPKHRVSRGDVIRETTTLRNDGAQFGRPDGAVVGSDAATYTFATLRRASVKGTTKLPGGTVRIAGLLSGPGTQTLRVTGGTGRFAGARGTCVVTNVSVGDALNVYRLRLP